MAAAERKAATGGELDDEGEGAATTSESSRSPSPNRVTPRGISHLLSTDTIQPVASTTSGGGEPLMMQVESAQSDCLAAADDNRRFLGSNCWR